MYQSLDEYKTEFERSYSDSDLPQSELDELYQQHLLNLFELIKEEKKLYLDELLSAEEEVEIALDNLKDANYLYEECRDALEGY